MYPLAAVFFASVAASAADLPQAPVTLSVWAHGEQLDGFIVTRVQAAGSYLSCLLEPNNHDRKEKSHD